MATARRTARGNGRAADITVELGAAGSTKAYVVVPQVSGEYVEAFQVPDFGETIKTEGIQRQSDILGRSSIVFPSPIYGFGRNVIPALNALDPTEYQRMWDSECETRFPGDVRLGILNNSATGEVGSSRIVGHVQYGGNLWTVWEEVAQGTTPVDIVSRTLSGTAFAGGGTVFTTAVNGDGARAFDLQSDGKQMLALTNRLNAVGDGRYFVYRSTNGTAWTSGALAGATNILTAATRQSTAFYVDGGLIAPRPIAGEAIVAVWDEANGEIELFSTTDSGTTMTAEIQIASNNGPQGIAVYPDIDSTDVVYLMTREGLYLVDTSPATWTATLILPLPPSTGNGRRMTVHQGKLWFGVGTGNNTTPAVFTMEVRGDLRVFQFDHGMDVLDGVPTDMLGQINWMESNGSWLYALLGGAAASRNFRVICHNGFGWHNMRKHGTANIRGDWLATDATDLFYGYQSASPNEHTVETLANAHGNPQSGLAITRQVSGILDRPEVNGGMPTTDGNFLQVRTDAVDLTTTAGEYVAIARGINGAVRTTLTEGNFVSATKVFTSNSGAGTQAVSFATRETLFRDNAAPTTDTPKVRSLEVVYMKKPIKRDGWRFTVDVGRTAVLQKINPSTVVANLETARDLAIQAIFRFGPDLSGGAETKLVDVNLPRRSLVLIQAGDTATSAINNDLTQTIGFVDVELREVV